MKNGLVGFSYAKNYPVKVTILHPRILLSSFNIFSMPVVGSIKRFKIF